MNDWKVTYEGQNISKGENVRIGNNVVIGNNVIIGDYVTIRHNIKIDEGVTIGTYAVIVSNSHVKNHVPPFEVWGGRPAKKINDAYRHIRGMMRKNTIEIWYEQHRGLK